VRIVGLSAGSGSFCNLTMSHINGGTPFRSIDHNDIGLNRRELVSAVRERVIRRMFQGVYVDASVPDSRELRIAGITLVAPRHAVISDSSASWIYGVDTFRPSERFRLTPAFLIPHGASRLRHEGIDCREAYIDPRDITEIDSLLITTPVRTAADLLRKLYRPYALAAADGLVRASLVSAVEIQDYLRPLRGFPGIVQARELARLIDPRAESPGESWTRLRLLDAGFPRPDSQIVITDRHGRELWRIDMGYEDRRIAVEYDGAEFHTLREDREHDSARRGFIRDDLGWRIAVVDKNSVLGEEADLEREVGGWLSLRPRLPRAW